MLSLFDYAENLPDEAKKRYKQKISLIGGADPFLRDVDLLTDGFPPVKSVDNVSYLVLRTSFATAEKLKA